MSTEVNVASAHEDFAARLAGLTQGGAVAKLRAARVEATRYTQGSHDALFDPQATGLSLEERLAAASYAASLSAAPEAAHAYRSRLLARGSSGTEALALLDTVAAKGAAFAPSAAAGTRLTAILSHTHALATLDAPPDRTALVRLKQAGLSTSEIVALSQLVAFVTYQVRVIAALRALGSKA
jgi:uncharacterized protein YciW